MHKKHAARTYPNSPLDTFMGLLAIAAIIAAPVAAVWFFLQLSWIEIVFILALIAVGLKRC